MQKFSEIIATFFYIGKIKYAPGTFGSLAAFPICYLIMHFTLNNQIIFKIPGLSFYEQQFITIILLEFLALAILFIAGTFCTKIYITDKINKDPKEVVIDEVVGQMLTIIFSSFSVGLIYFSPVALKMNAWLFDFIFIFLMPFCLFRLFDIMKPWPINLIDQKMKGAFGVMIDDIVAAIFAVISHYIIIAIILDLSA